MAEWLFPIFWVIDQILWIFLIILIVRAVLSWLIGFNVVNGRNEVVRQIDYLAWRITEPLMRPVRRLLPRLDGIDLSLMVVGLLIIVVRMYLWVIYSKIV